MARYGAALLAATALSVAPQIASAQTWDGDANSNWSDGNNWVGDSAPTAASTAILGGAGANQPSLNGASAAQSLIMNGTGNTLSLSGQTLTLSQGLALSAGTITGPGAVTMGTTMSMTGGTISGGSFSATGTATLSGGLIHDNATLSAGNFTINGSAVISGSATLASSGTYSVTGVSVGGSLTGSGAVTTNGSVTLSGTNTYSGNTTLDSGTLTVGSNSALGAGTLLMNAGTTLRAGAAVNLSNNIITSASGPVGIDTNGFDTTLSGTLTVNNAIAKAGAGTLTLSGANTYSGATSVGTGTLRAGSANTLSSNSAHTVDAGATLDLNSFNQTIGSLAGVGNVTLGSATLTTGGNNSSTAFSGTISGTGGLTKAGPGTMTLSGSNSYSGATTVNAGTLQIGVAQAISASSAVTVASGATFSLNSNTQAVGSLAGAGNVTLGSATLTAGGNNASTTFSGVISGTGGLAKNGTGTMTLSGANTYSGNTTVNAGTLQLGTGGSLSSGTALIINGGTFDLNGHTQTVRVLGGGAGGTLALGAGALTFDPGSGSTSFGGTITGTGSLTISSGELELSGANTYSGGTTISGGALQIRNGSIVGTVTNNGSLVFTGSSGTTTFSNVVLGSGGLRQYGSGTTVLIDASTYTGSTSVEGGTLRIGIDGALPSATSLSISGGTLDLDGHAQSVGRLTGSGNLVLGSGGALTVNGSSSGTFSGVISGAGSLTKAGSGTMTLSGANTYSGGTNVNGGTVAASSNGNLGSTSGGLAFNGGSLQYNAAFNSARGITLNSGGGTFNTNGFDAILSGNIGGSGGLTKAGLGTLTLGGTLTYTGGTTVTGGVLKLDSGVVLPTTGALLLNGGTLQTTGNVTLPDLSGSGGTVEVGTGTLTVNQNTNTTYGGTLTGAGGLDKTGTGTLILSGTNTYTGTTSVTGGRLSVNGSITSDVTVGSGGNLGGSGRITGNVVANGTVAPGNSIGTLNITGTFTQASGSIYQVEVNAQGQSDLINVTGNAVIQANSTVQVIAEQGSYARNTTYTILTTTTGVSGTYANVTSNFAFLRPSLSYDANNVYLTLFQSSNAFASGAQTSNQFAVGTALDLASPTAAGDFSTVIGALAVLSTQQGPAALNAISGQNYAGFSSAAVAGAQLFMSNFANQAGGANRKGSATGNRVALAEACDVACETAVAATWGVWGGEVGGTGTLGGNSNAGTTTYNLGGFVAGLDRAVDPDFRVGVTVGYTSGRQWTSGFAGTGYADTVQVGLYSTFMRDAFYVDGLVGYAHSDNRLQRQIAIPGLAMRVANGSTGVNQFFGQVETGWRFDIGGAPEAYVTPFVRLQGSTATQAAFSENGANSLSLNVAAQTTNSLRTVLGAQLGGAMDLGWREKLSAQLKLGWAHEFANTDRPVTASFAGAPAFPFTTYGAAPQRDGVVLGLNAGTAIAERTSVYLRYEGEFSGLDNAQALSLGVRMTW